VARLLSHESAHCPCQAGRVGLGTAKERTRYGTKMLIDHTNKKLFARRLGEGYVDFLFRLARLTLGPLASWLILPASSGP